MFTPMTGNGSMPLSAASLRRQTAPFGFSKLRPKRPAAFPPMTSLASILHSIIMLIASRARLDPLSLIGDEQIVPLAFVLPFTPVAAFPPLAARNAHLRAEPHRTESRANHARPCP